MSMSEVNVTSVISIKGEDSVDEKFPRVVLGCCRPLQLPSSNNNSDCRQFNSASVLVMSTDSTGILVVARVTTERVDRVHLHHAVFVLERAWATWQTAKDFVPPTDFASESKVRRSDTDRNNVYNIHSYIHRDRTYIFYIKSDTVSCVDLYYTVANCLFVFVFSLSLFPLSIFFWLSSDPV